ncbi:hypothetical protein [Terriglobus tenax]|uniref:hypothetical protein n=1 Tax=Terriglobus tenax TaxID=1111115 RepID=UPI0021DFA950|nr:hypothetical protein [Terriglobus tenax]
MEPRFTADPRSVPGDFYVIQNECLGCGIPHSIAPDLVNWVDISQPHCGWIKQPSSKKEIKQAIQILQKQDFGCHRYAGADPSILRAVPECCDYFVDPNVAAPDFTASATAQENWLRRLWRKLTGR